MCKWRVSLSWCSLLVTDYFAITGSIDARLPDESFFDELVVLANEHHCRKVAASMSPEEGAPHFHSGPAWRLRLLSVMTAMRRICRTRGMFNDDDRGLVETDEVYQFGIGGGWSMQLLRRVYPRSRFVGFDSFQGLPAEAQHEDTHENWLPGAMKHEIQTKELAEALGGPKPTRFVPGFFNESLTPTLKDELNLKPATYIDVDVDLYISSMQVLDYMFTSGLVEVGTLIGYDDWWCIPCSRNSTNVFAYGEGMAHYDITHKYGVRFKCVAGPCLLPREGPLRKCNIHAGWGTLFIVMEIGAKKADTGFAMSQSEVKAWQRNPFCTSWIKERDEIIFKRREAEDMKRFPALP